MQAANEIANNENTQKALQQAQGFIDTLTKKYTDSSNELSSDPKAKALYDDALQLWQEHSSSAEANELILSSSELINNWSEYSKSQQGEEIINKLSSLLSEHSSNYSNTLASFINDNANTDTAEHVKLVASSASKVVLEDEDVQELINKFKQSDSTVTTTDNNNATDTSIINTNDIIDKSHTYIKSFKDSDVGKQYIAKTSELLRSNDLKPDELIQTAQKLYEDENERNKFIVKMKDAALDFLMSYLPTVVIPPIENKDEYYAYRYGLIYIIYYIYVYK